ncbi:MAG: hypothetical protein JW749_03820 [Sedimentisphaerales bacterium]|nr:hypothetical protein [Sedimentisphaerales bacterium]
MESQSIIQEHLGKFRFGDSVCLFGDNSQKTNIEYAEVSSCSIQKFTNEFWTSKQRQADSLHEISYRACFKPQLPRFFIELLTKEQDVVYDPFSGRGTTCIEAGLLNRNVIANDINPLSKILSEPRFFIPDIETLKNRLYSIPFTEKANSTIDLSMFYHSETEAEVLSLRKYLEQRRQIGKEDELDHWIRMVATNRLTGHSSGFFSVYTLPPNQAVSQESQKKINEKRRQAPEYRNTKEIILKKSESLIRDISDKKVIRLRKIGENSLFLMKDARFTPEIESGCVQLTVTSPPFLDVVQYDEDNWLRCWFNSINAEEIASKITMTKKVEDWCGVMSKVFEELYRITKNGGYVAFEVGEVKGGELKLEEYVVPLGLTAGFSCEGIMINQQAFTKTANIWGVSNNEKGTNTNRIVIFRKSLI